MFKRVMWGTGQDSSRVTVVPLRGKGAARSSTGLRPGPQRSGRPQPDELVGTGLGAPHLAGAAEELTHLSARRREREGPESLPVRLEPDERVAGKVAHPDEDFLPFFTQSTATDPANEYFSRVSVGP
jgi:hypothetical protein